MPKSGFADTVQDSAASANSAAAEFAVDISTRRRRTIRRGAVALAVVVLAFWALYHPAKDEQLLAVLPPSSSVVGFVRDIASQEKALVESPIVAEALKAFGEEPEHVAEENEGTYWTLFFLTGSRSALSLVEKSGECGGLGWYLAGASAAGWKTKILEFLWRIKYVPFLGELKTTESGTRYMEFHGHGFLPENGIVLGLDIVDGILVATLAQDPTLVEELAARVRSGTREDAAPVLSAGISKGWANHGIKHRFWVDPFPLGLPADPFTIDFGSFAESGLTARATLTTPEIESPSLPRIADSAKALESKLDVDSDGTFLFAAGALPAAHALPFFGGVFPARPAGPAAIWASTAPYAGRISILEAPSVSGVVPIDSAQSGSDAPLEATKTAVSGVTASLRPRWRTAPDGTALLHFKNLKTNLFGDTPNEDCYWMRRSEDGSSLEFGTHYGSAAAQRKAAKQGSTLAAKLSQMLALDSEADAVAFVNFPVLSETARQAGSLITLARRFGLKMTDEEALETSNALAAIVALQGLGEVSASTRIVAPAHGESGKVVISAKASGPRH